VSADRWKPSCIIGDVGRSPGLIQIKRTYEPPARGDGRRILVERLWPRGMKKEALAADAWLKDVAPSTELRKWFGHQVERWEEFRLRYRAELDANPAAWAPILEAARGGKVTLLFSAHDTLHNGAIVLRDYLNERESHARSAPRTKRPSAPTARTRRASGRSRRKPTETSSRRSERPSLRRASGTRSRRSAGGTGEPPGAAP
jgi:uncharacterized protein YeaO (DUF488 family)